MKRGGTLARRTGLETRSALRSHSELKTRAALSAGLGPKARQHGAKKRTRAAEEPAEAEFEDGCE